MVRMHSLLRQRPHGPWLGKFARVEAAWYAGLVLLLCTDLVLSNIDVDLPLGLVLVLWAAAFFLPVSVMYGWRRWRR